MPPSISTISSLTRTISSTSVHSLKDHPTPRPDWSAPALSQPEPSTIKHIKTGSVQVSISEIPKRKPLAIPVTTTTTTITATAFQNSPSAEDGGTVTNPPRPIFDKLKQKLPFQSNKKKQRIFLGAVGGVILLHLILLIGLVAGLSARNKKNDNLAYSNLPLPSAHGGPYTGELTYYAPGLGACGIESAPSEAVCAVSQYLYDAVSTGPNPNTNPLCGKRLRLRKGGRSVDVTVVDRCVGCQPNDIDVTLSVFTQLALEEQGRVDVQWAWLDDTPLPRQQG
ncbi:hypothetical protein EMCG_01293 [[Emmonsia] crescens]|uniref:RlpA-like protein double-psi beta-barrel domain-containing protein n=1 Tax=[Emmonsia] crescens TaxID=73230 RepID=A0A0G2I3T2_9EURO|nr:hypothetical protein EMCG_01293 [Emmonsia crescens UAMH 3008]